jgi:hypothetical protein
MSQECMHIVKESALRNLFREAVDRTVAVTAEYCRVRAKDRRWPEIYRAAYSAGLAWIRDELTAHGCAQLSPATAEAEAPLSWALEELIDWASHLTRLERLGDYSRWAPLTWLPRGEHALGTRDAAAAIEERLALLREELRDYGVGVDRSPPGEAAA